MDRLIPQGFEIHHRDENPENNDFENLICVHQIDHNKLHRAAAPTANPYEMPF